MQRRRLLAMATLTALLLSMGILQPAPMGTGAELAPHTQQAAPYTPQAAEAPATAQWSYAWGMDGGDALAFAVLGTMTCAPFIWIGSVACGLTGAA